MLSATQPTSSVPARRLRCPPDLADLARAFVAEEATAALRHDARNRLATVRNGVFYIQRRLDGHSALLESDPRLGQFLRMIDDEATALGNLLVTRLPSAEQVSPSKSDPLEVVASLAQSVFGPEGASLSVSGPGARPVRAHPGELGLALFCVLENAFEAIEAAPERSVQLRVTLSKHGLVELEVSDAGPGFDTADLAQVLRPFYSTKPGRLGVGLKIAKRIAGRWGGDIEIGRSEQGGGRTSLLFPAA